MPYHFYCKSFITKSTSTCVCLYCPESPHRVLDTPTRYNFIGSICCDNMISILHHSLQAKCNGVLGRHIQGVNKLNLYSNLKCFITLGLE